MLFWKKKLKEKKRRQCGSKNSICGNFSLNSVFEEKLGILCKLFVHFEWMKLLKSPN